MSPKKVFMGKTTSISLLLFQGVAEIQCLFQIISYIYRYTERFSVQSHTQGCLTQHVCAENLCPAVSDSVTFQQQHCFSNHPSLCR